MIAGVLLLSACGGGEESSAEASGSDATGASAPAEGQAAGADGEAPAEEAAADGDAAAESAAGEPSPEEAPEEAPEEGHEDGSAGGEHSEATTPTTSAPTASAAASAEPARQDRAALPKDFPAAVPLPADLKVEDVGTLGTGSERTWLVTLRASSDTWKQSCREYTQALQAVGFDEVLGGDSASGSGSAMRGQAHDVTVLCDNRSIDLVVNPSLTL